MNLQEEEILKLASLGNHGNLENAVDVLKRSLAVRNKSYKKLMIQCNILGRSESRTQHKLEKAKELVKRLKKRVQELEKESEEKENSLIRDLRSSKKFKADQTKSWNIIADSGFRSPNSGYGNEATKLDEVMEHPCSGKSQADHLKHEGMCDLKAEGNLGKKDVIDLDADDFVFRNEHKTEISAKLFHTSGNTLDSQNKSGICQNDNRQSAAFECNTTFAAKETSFVNHTDSIGKSTFQENFTTELHILQENPISGTTKMSSSTLTREKETLTIGGISKQGSRLSSGIGPQKFRHFSPFSDDDWAAIHGMKGNHKQSDDDFETPGIFGADKTRKSIGSWCKGSTATGSASTNTNKGNLIAVGPDGRGGKVKILRDLGGRFQDSKSQALWPKAPKVGGKVGQSQIDHFFGKK